MFEALGSAIYSVLGTGMGTVPVYNTIAPQGGSPPFVIFQAQEPGVSRYSFDGASGEEVSGDWVVKVVSDRYWAGEADGIASTLETVMQDGLGTVAGWRVLRCRRSGRVRYRDRDGFWHVGGIYRVDLQKS